MVLWGTIEVPDYFAGTSLGLKITAWKSPVPIFAALQFPRCLPHRVSLVLATSQEDQQRESMSSVKPLYGNTPLEGMGVDMGKQRPRDGRVNPGNVDRSQKDAITVAAATVGHTEPSAVYNPLDEM